MSVAQTLTRLRDLRLSGMADAFERQLSQPELSDIGFNDRLAMIVDAEHHQRESNRLKRLIQNANFPEPAAPEDYEDIATRGLSRELFRTLTRPEWLQQRLNLLIVGPTGVGKSWISSAIGNQACRNGLSVLFWRVSELYNRIVECHGDGSLPALKARLVKPSLLILDDLGLGQMTPTVAQVLLEVMERRQYSGSLIVTSQFPPATWHDLFPDPTTADATMDRVVHQSHRINLKGESLRRKRGERRLKDFGFSTTSE